MARAVSSEFTTFSRALLCYHGQARICPNSVSGPELRVKRSETKGEKSRRMELTIPDNKCKLR